MIIIFLLKCFLLFSILFGSFVYVLFSFTSRSSPLSLSLIAGSFFGVFMTLALARKQIGPDGVMPTNVKGEITLQKNIEIAAAKVKDVLNGLGFKLKESKNNTFLASSGMGGTSWGENIRVDLEKINQEQTLVRIHSKPKFMFNFLDSGANLLNVERIKQDLT